MEQLIPGEKIHLPAAFIRLQKFLGKDITESVIIMVTKGEKAHEVNEELQITDSLLRKKGSFVEESFWH